MTERKTKYYEEIRGRIIRIIQGKNIIKKALLIGALIATGLSLVMLLIKAIQWLITFILGVVVLGLIIKPPSSLEED